MNGAFSSMVGYSGGPERAWCGTYCSILDDLSRDLLEEDSTAQLQLQGYQGSVLDVMVASRVTTLHGHRVALNRKSWEQHEEPRTPENTVIYEARLDERDGELHLYHPEAEQFVHDMFANARRVSARAEQEFGITGLYNKQEHETFLRIEKAVLSGQAAAGMWATYDASGTVRYVSQIERQNGAVVARWIDVGRAGRDLTPDEGVSLLHRIARDNHDSRLVTGKEIVPHLITEHEVIQSVAVWEAAGGVVDKRQTTTFRYEPSFARHALSDTHREVAREIETRIHPGISAMGTLKVAEEMHTKISDEGSKFHGFSLVELIDRHVTPRVLQTIDALFVCDKASNSEHTVQKDAALTGNHKNGGALNNKKRRLDEFGPGKALALEHRINEKPGYRRATARSSGEHAGETKAVEKSIARHAGKELRKEKKELRKVKREAKKDSVKVQSLRSERIEPLRTAKERKGRKKRRKVSMGGAAVTRIYTFEKQGRRERKIGVKKNAVAEKMTPIVMLKPDKQERQEKKRLRRAVEKSVRRHKKRELRVKNKELRRIEKREAKKDSVKIQPLKIERVEPFKERKQRMQRKEREAVVAIRFAWALWMLLVQKEANTPKSIFIRHRLATQGDALQNQEEKPWVLLSIIWYLTAIREQGMHKYPMSHISPVQQTIPQHAVIYAFVS